MPHSSSITAISAPMSTRAQLSFWLSTPLMMMPITWVFGASKSRFTLTPSSVSLSLPMMPGSTSQRTAPVSGSTRNRLSAIGRKLLPAFGVFEVGERVAARVPDQIDFALVGLALGQHFAFLGRERDVGQVLRLLAVDRARRR